MDTNILLDVLLDRQPFCHPAQILWTLAQKRSIKAAISAVSMSHVFFVLKKLTGGDKAYQALTRISEDFQIVDTKNATIRKALQTHLPDFEDALQYFSALQFRAQAIITRDPAGFEHGKLPVLDCTQYLSLLQTGD